MLAWTNKHVARDVKRRELRNALLITVTGDREKTAMLRLDECDVGGQTLCLQAIPARMTCEEGLGVGRRGGTQRVHESPPHPRLEGRLP